LNTSEEPTERKQVAKIDTNFVQVWTAPAEWRIMKLEPEEQKLVKYGKELIAHTSEYLGPKGSVKQISNGMNCQNCHLEAGTKPYGNNYSAVYTTYPKYRPRSGAIEDIYKRQIRAILAKYSRCY
jgi:thiosulfate dehydrogenase